MGNRAIIAAILVPAISSCYQPTIPGGHPCSPTDGCPGGQVCSPDGVCVHSLTDAGGSADSLISPPIDAAACDPAFEFAKKIVAENAATGDYLGLNVALSQDSIAFGIASWDHQYVDGGAVHVFATSGQWEQVQSVTAQDAGEGKQFGNDVAIDGDLMVVGDSADGSAYVFRSASGSWTQVQKLTGDGPEPGSSFGRSVAVRGDVIVVGAELEGAAYVFTATQSDPPFERTARLTNSSMFFGGDVAVDGDRVVVAAAGDSEKGSFAGAVFVYAPSGDEWQLEAKLTAGDGAEYDGLGDSVDVRNKWLVVGSSGNDQVADNAGAAYLFRRDQGDWHEVTKLVADDGDADDSFGNAVALGDDFIAVGALQSDDLGPESGAAYLFVYGDDDQWTQHEKVTDPVGAPGWRFGYSVSAYDRMLAIGAPLSGYGSGYVYRKICE